MKVFSTRRLKELVAPDDLGEILELLKEKGNITFYRISAATTCIEISKLAEVSLFFDELNKVPINPHPYVKNKRNNKG
jgi:hypothetical protein